MRVLHVGEYVQGGVATYVSTLLQHPDVPEIEDFLICSEENSEHSWSLPEDHVTYYPYHRSLFQIFSAMRAVRKEIARVGPDVVYCHSTWAGLFARFPFFFFPKRCRVLYNAHGWAFLRDTAEWKRKVYALVERLLLLRTDAVINVSRYEYEAAIRYHLPAGKQCVIYSGISGEKAAADDASCFPKGKINLLFVGRFDPQKGVDLLLNAFSQCARSDIHLTLIGDNVIGGLFVPKESSARVTFLGWVPHDRVGNYYAACDAVIMPSRWEAFGLVAVEAMKYGKPVLASNRGALPELVKDGVNGYVFSLEDPKALAELLNRLDPKELALMGRAAKKEFLGKYQMERMAEETIRLYRKGNDGETGT